MNTYSTCKYIFTYNSAHNGRFFYTLCTTVYSTAYVHTVYTYVYLLELSVHALFDTQGGHCRQTKYIDNCLEPQWNETVKFSLKQQPLTTGDLLYVQVFDYELIGHDR